MTSGIVYCFEVQDVRGGQADERNTDPPLTYPQSRQTIGWHCLAGRFGVDAVMKECCETLTKVSEPAQPER